MKFVTGSFFMVVAGLVVANYLYPATIAYIIESFVSLVLSSYVHSFRITAIKISPSSLCIEGFSIDILPSKLLPRIQLSWKSFTIKIRLHCLWQTLSKHSKSASENTSTMKSLDRAIDISFQELNVNCKDLKYRLILGPSASKRPDVDITKVSLENASTTSKPFDRWNDFRKAKILKSSFIIQSILSNVKVTMKEMFDFDFDMTDHKSKIVGSASKLEIYFDINRCSTSDGFFGVMDILNGSLEINYNNERAVDYFGDKAIMTVDYHLPSGMQAIRMELTGKDEAAVSFQPFLSFYKEYQKAEDDSIEAKLSRSINVAGKMYDISMTLEHMRVSLKDPRGSGTCVMEINDMMIQMQSFSITSYGNRYIRGIHRLFIDSKPLNGPNDIERITRHLQKDMRVAVSSVRWPGYDKPSNTTSPCSAFVHGAKMEKTLQVKNDGDYVDTEVMNASAEVVNFQRVPLILLEWLITLQEMANTLPTSRFAHLKQSTINGTNASMTFSTYTTDQNASSTAIDDADELVTIESKNILGIRQSKPRQEMSSFDVSAEVVQVYSSLFLSGMPSKYRVFVKRNKKRSSHSAENTRIGMHWCMRNIHGKMLMGYRTVFDYMAIDSGLQIDFLVGGVKRQVAVHDNHRNTTQKKDIPLSKSHPNPSDRQNTTNQSPMGSDGHNQRSPEMKVKASRKSFLLVNERTLQPHLSMITTTEFMKTSKFEATWNGVDITTYLGNVEMKASMGGMIKFMTSFNMIKAMTNRVLGHMSRIKAMTYPNYIIPKIDPSLDPFSLSIMDHMHVRLYLNDSTLTSNPSDEKIPLILDCNMEKVKIGQSIHKQTYQWSSCVVLCNDWADRPAFIMKEFDYISILHHNSSKNKDRRRKDVSGINQSINHPSETKRTKRRSMIMTTTDQMPIKHQTINMKEFRIGMSTLNRFGETSEAFFQQYEAYKLASSILQPSNPSTEELEAHRLRPDPYIMKANFGVWTFEMDGLYDDVYQRDIAQIKYNEFSMYLDSSQRELDMYTTLANLDFNLEECETNTLKQQLLMHANASGGDIIMTMKSFGISYMGLDVPTILMKEVTISGQLYSCSVSDPRIHVDIIDMPLGDHPMQQISPHEQGVSTGHHTENGHALDATLYIPFTKSQAPNKLYFSLDVKCLDCIVTNDIDTAKGSAAYNEAMKWFQAPIRDSFPPLAWWDNMRYWFHGKYCIQIKEFKFQHYLEKSSSRSKIIATMTNYHAYIDNKSVEIFCKDIGIDAELTLSKPKTKSSRSKPSEFNRQYSNSEYYHKLFRLSGLLLTFSHSRSEMIQSYSSSQDITKRSGDNRRAASYYSHHDVYLHPCRREYPHDKFALFRLKPMSISWSIEIQFIDSPQKPITINARLDVLAKINQLLSQSPSPSSEANPVPSGSNTPLSSTTSNSHHGLRDDLDVNNNQLDVNTPHSISQQTEPSTPSDTSLSHQISINDLISTLDLQLDIHSLLIQSWESRTCFNGVVLSWKKAEMQFKFVREIPSMDRKTGSNDCSINGNCDNINKSSQEVYPFRIDHMLSEIHFAEIYARQWNVGNTLSIGEDIQVPQSPASAARRKLNDNSMRTQMLLGIHNQASVDRKGLVEPSSLSEVQSLLVPIYKLAHATKVEISLSEDGILTQTLPSDSQIINNTGEMYIFKSNFKSYLINEVTEILISHNRIPKAIHSLDNIHTSYDESVQDHQNIYGLGDHVDLHSFGLFGMFHSISSHGGVHFILGSRRRKIAMMFSNGEAMIPSKAIEYYRDARIHWKLQTEIKPIILPEEAALKTPTKAKKSKSGSKRSRERVPRITYTGFRPLLSSFVANHAALTPPSLALPASYQGSRNLHASELTRTTSLKTIPIGLLKSKPRDNKSNIQPKTWGLKVIDMRLLWTLEIRDVLFAYVSKYYDLFSESELSSETHEHVNTMEETIPKTVPKTEEVEADGTRSRSMTKDTKATIEDFLSIETGDGFVKKLNYSGNKTKAKGKRRATVTFQQDLAAEYHDLATIEEKEIKSKARPVSQVISSKFHSKVGLTIDPTYDRKEDETKLVTFIPFQRNPSETGDTGTVPDNIATVSDGIESEKPQSGQSLKLVHPNSILRTRSTSTDSGEMVTARTSHRSEMPTKRSGYIKSELLESLLAERISKDTITPRTKSKYNYLSVPIKSSGNDNTRHSKGLPSTDNSPNDAISSLLSYDPNDLNYGNDSNPNDVFQSPVTKGKLRYPNSRSSDNTPGSRTSASVSPVGPSIRSTDTSPIPNDETSQRGKNASPTINSPRQLEAAKSLSSRSFMVDLIDPQINFLDVKSHSSVIIVASQSSLEGSRGVNALINSDNNHLNSSSKKTHLRDPSPSNVDPSKKSGAAKRRSEIRLRLNGVSAYTAPTYPTTTGESTQNGMVYDVVHWKVMQNTITSIPTKNSPQITQQLKRRNSIRLRQGLNGMIIEQDNSPLKVAIKDFVIKAQYNFWLDVLAEEAKNMTVFLTRDEFVCAFLLDLPEIIVDTDSTQFYAVLNVIKNLLLVPPPPLSSKISQQETDETEQNTLTLDEGILEKHGLRLKDIHLDISKPYSRDILKALIEESLLKPAIIEHGMARDVQVFIGKGVWLLRSSNNSSQSTELSIQGTSAVETGFTGVYATITFHEDRSSSLLFETQRFWAKDVSSISSSETELTGLTTTSSPSDAWVMMPALRYTEPCVRCGQPFSLENNHAKSCVFHANADGFPGDYTENSIYDELTGQYLNVMMWTCCNRTQRDAPGCTSLPHMCKEIRAEASPSTKIQNIEMQVLHTLEISFFPGASYDLRVQVNRSVAMMLHDFFSIDDTIVKEYEMNMDKSSSKLHFDGLHRDIELDHPHDLQAGDQMSLDSDITENGAITNGNHRPLSVKERLGIATKKLFQRRENLNTNAIESDKKPPPDPATSTAYYGKKSSKIAGGVNTEGSNGTKNNSLSSNAVVRQEGLYINYMRVGDINVDVSTYGFPINVENYRAVVEPFICRGEVLEWHKLISKLEYHAVLSVTKNFATNSLNRLGNFLFGGGSNNTNNSAIIRSPALESMNSTPDRGNAPALAAPAAPMMTTNTRNLHTGLYTSPGILKHGLLSNVRHQSGESISSTPSLDTKSNQSSNANADNEDSEEILRQKKMLLLGKKKSNKIFSKFKIL